MANSSDDFLGSFTLESPDFKRALKILIKYEIHVLLQRLSDTGEESVVITASIADRTNGHLGSQKGRGFLREAKLKSLEEQFLHYCSAQSFDQRSQLDVGSTGSSPGYIKQEPREMLTGYNGQEITNRQSSRKDGDYLEGKDNRRYYQESRSPIPVGNDMMDQSEELDQSEESIVNTCINEHVENGVAQFLSKYNDSAEIIKDCYNERGLIGKCTDACCQGTYLDLVGPSIRPAIPTLDGSVGNWNGNSPDNPGSQNDNFSYSREQNYYEVVDLTKDKTEGAVNDYRARQNTSGNLSDDRKSACGLHDQTDYKVTSFENIFQNGTGHGQGMLSSFVPRSRIPESPIEHGISSQSAADLSKQQLITNQHDLMMRDKEDTETRHFRTTVANEVEFEKRGKRKLCSRVPECKLRHLLQAGNQEMTKLINDKSKVSVKSEPLFEDNIAKTETPMKSVEENGLKVSESAERGVDTEGKSLDGLVKKIKEEERPATVEEQKVNEMKNTELGRSLRFVCRYCNQMFKNKQYRELHEKLHLARHPYVCESCGAGFDEETVLEEHSKIHITNPLLKCDNCGYRTSRKFRMNSHKEICGKPSKLYLCPYCQKPFLAKRYMKVHMKSHDLSNVHHCPYCVNTYPLKNSLLKHMKAKHKKF